MPTKDTAKSASKNKKKATKKKHKKESKTPLLEYTKVSESKVTLRRDFIPLDPVLKTFLECDEASVIEFFMNNVGGVTDGDNFYFADYESPILLQAHIDTVRLKRDDKSIPNPVCIGNVIFNVNGILGADDRAGCYMIWQIFQYVQELGLPSPSILLTNYEESGSDGMKEFLKETSLVDSIRENVNMIIALDRRGCAHYVDYVDNPSEIGSYLTSFGFAKEWGSFSDSKLLSQETRIPQVNLAVGYHKEHTVNETLHMDEFDLCLGRLKKIIQSPIDKLYPLKAYVPPTYSWDSWKSRGDYAVNSNRYYNGIDGYYEMDDDDYHYDPITGLYVAGRTPETKRNEDGDVDGNIGGSRTPIISRSTPDEIAEFCELCGFEDTILNLVYEKESGCGYGTQYMLCDDCLPSLKDYVDVVGIHYNAPKPYRSEDNESRDIVEKAGCVKGLSPSSHRGNSEPKVDDEIGDTEDLEENGSSRAEKFSH